MLRNARVEGVGGYMPKRCEGVGLCQRYVTLFLANTAWFTIMSSRPTQISR